MAEGRDTGAGAARLFEEVGLPVLEAYTEIPCLSPAFEATWAETGHLERAAELLRSFCAARPVGDASVELVRLPGRTPVLLADVAATPEAAGCPTTLVYGHFDKQPPLGAWRDGLHPFRAVREGDRLYGRGTADDGYATFAAFAAFEALARDGLEHGRIVLLVESGEESGSPDLEAYLDHLATRLGPIGLVVCLDSGCVTYDRLWFTTSLRGVVVGTLRVEVLREGVHSGHAGGIVPSSFRLARRLLDRIEDQESGAIRVEALASTIPPHRRAEIAAIAKEFGDEAAGVFPTTPKLRLAGASVAERIELGTWRAALEVTGQDGIPDVPAGGNVLRAYTALKLSVRLPPNVDAEAAADELRRALTEDPPEGASVHFEIEHPGQGWDAPPVSPWLDAALGRASRTYFGKPPASLGLGGSIPFMASLGRRYPEAQFLATGVLGPESNAHGPNEFLHVPTAKSLAACLVEILAALPASTAVLR